MNNPEDRTTEEQPSKRVYSVELKAQFLVLADDSDHAEKIADGLWPIRNIEIELPASCRPWYSACVVLNQSDEIKARCANA